MTTGVIITDYMRGARGEWLVMLDVFYFVTVVVYPLARAATRNRWFSKILFSSGCNRLARRGGQQSAGTATRLTELADASGSSSLSRKIRSTGW